MNTKLWTRWVMQTARRWNDISPVIMKTGVNSVDKDHRMMIECALELNNLISEMESNSVSLDLIARQGELLNKFYAITKNHFTREETLILRFGIDGIKTQQREHAVILGMLQDCIDKFDSGQITVNIELKQSILDWVVHHINEIDNKVFALSNWRNVLASATCWEDVSHIINSTGFEHFDNQHKELVEVSLRLNKYVSS